MDPIVNALLNAGSAGVIGVVLYLLHSQAIKAFQAEQKESRIAFQTEQLASRTQTDKMWLDVMTVTNQHHLAEMAEFRRVSEKIGGLRRVEYTEELIAEIVERVKHGHPREKGDRSSGS
jgi:hypothetical protein